MIACARVRVCACARAPLARCWHGASMGAWGSGPFENDDAADFAGDLSETNDADQIVAQLEDALAAVTRPELSLIHI